MKSVMQFLTMMALLLLAGCGAGKTQDMMAKIEKAKTGDEVRSALGKPDKYDAVDIPVIGKAETLTYKGSDGEVQVIVHNNKVFSKAATSGSSK